ncbi:TetR/AcrR family transcriptional regulator [Rhizobium sp. FY34]|uniref:TetR/AcrR family transcriptional regulator n=1 Tax=Rhizobium sp. FY34 TaxID=2562309 RepID=UPI0014857ED4|nr:TetR/AcrR family transcriptional regulator [Rhizobium sp. FY34]
MVYGYRMKADETERMKNDNPAPVRRERGSLSQVKSEKILKAARDLFAERGFGATTMDAIAQRANVGKATVYAHFECKEKLFSEIIVREGRQHTLALQSKPGEPLASVLEKFALDAIDLLLSPITVAVYRTAAAEAVLFPDLAKRFFEEGPAALMNEFATFLASAMAKGELRSEQPGVAAAQFFGGILGDMQIRALLGLADTIDLQYRKNMARAGVEAFLKAYSP